MNRNCSFTGVIRSRRGRGRPSGTSRGVSESSLEGHDADIYEFNDTEEEETAVVSTHAISTPLEIADSKSVQQLHDDNIIVGAGSQQVLDHFLIDVVDIEQRLKCGLTGLTGLLSSMISMRVANMLRS